MALSRHNMATSRRFQSQRRVRFCLPNNEYMEAKEQFDREVLFTDDYYNGIIQIRLGGNAVKSFLK